MKKKLGVWLVMVVVSFWCRLLLIKVRVISRDNFNLSDRIIDGVKVLGW